MAASGSQSTRRPTNESLRRPPFERLLDRRLQSVSTFVSSDHDDSQAGSSIEPHAKSQWSNEMPQAILFPANKPSCRADAVILDQWMTNAFANYAQRASASQGTSGEDEQLSKAIEDLVPILSIGLHETVRQVSQHCLERGVVLEKIWRTYVELIERALAETRAALRRHKEKSARVEADLQRTRRELADLQEKHPEQIAKLSNTLAGKFAQRQEELEDQLKSVGLENQALSQHLREQGASLYSWFPLFTKYKDSKYRKSLAQRAPEQVTGGSPEARLAADFKRILTTMPADGRRRVGFFISSLLGLRGSQLADDTVEALTERSNHNKWKIEQLENRLRELKGGGL